MKQDKTLLSKQATDESHALLPNTPPVQEIEISLQIDTGNIRYQEFADIEKAADFVRTYYRNPEKILRRITGGV